MVAVDELGIMVPLQVTFFIPPGMFVGTRKPKPERNVFPARPEDGTRVTHIPPVNVVVAEVALGSNVTCASGNGVLNVEPVIV